MTNCSCVDVSAQPLMMAHWAGLEANHSKWAEQELALRVGCALCLQDVDVYDHAELLGQTTTHACSVVFSLYLTSG